MENKDVPEKKRERLLFCPSDKLLGIDFFGEKSVMRIIDKKILAESSGARIIRLDVSAADIAAKARPGQFVALMVSEKGERIPLTIVDKDVDKGTITLIFQELGLTTGLLGKLQAGDSLYALAGPLGRATGIKKYGNVILAGGGVGIAEIYPVGRALKNAGNRVTTILGGRTKDLVILEAELRQVSDEFHIATDDGSCGRKGFVTDVLKEVLARVREPQNTNLVYAVGPIPMMKAVAAVTKPLGIKTVVSLNALMVDATGMCGCCRVTIAGIVKFSCIDGPEFDGHLVDWEELEKRNKVYDAKEKHICKLK